MGRLAERLTKLALIRGVLELRDRRLLPALAAALLLVSGVIALQPSRTGEPGKIATNQNAGSQADAEIAPQTADESNTGASPSANRGRASTRGTGATASKSRSSTSSVPYKGEVGVTATSITIGAIYAQSGVFAAFTTQYAKVFRAAFNDINDREGGIYGRKLLLETADEGDSSSQALAAARQLSEKVFGYTTFIQETAEANFAESNRIPALTGLGDITPGAVNGEYKYSFQVGTSPGYYTARNAPSFIHARFPNLVDRTAFVTGEVYPRAEEAFVKAAKRHAVTVVHVETLALNQAQCFNAVQNVQRSNPKVVFVILGPIEAGCFFRDAKAAGFAPQFATLLNIPQNAASGGTDDGVPGIVPYFSLDSDAGRKMAATYRKYNNEEVTFPANDRAWSAAESWIQWIKAAGPEPTRAAFPMVVETGGPWANGFDGPQKFSRDIHVGSEHTIAGFQAGGGNYTITDPVWRKTYDGIEDPPFFPFRK